MKRFIIGLVVLMCGVGEVEGATYLNDFDDGLGADFEAYSNNDLFSIDEPIHFYH